MWVGHVICLLVVNCQNNVPRKMFNIIIEHFFKPTLASLATYHESFTSWFISHPDAIF